MSRGPAVHVLPGALAEPPLRGQTIKSPSQRDAGGALLSVQRRSDFPEQHLATLLIE